MQFSLFDIINKTSDQSAVLNTPKEADSLSNINPYNKNVEMDLTAGDFISGETVLLFSGPPTLSMAINNLLSLTGSSPFNALKSMGLVVSATIQNVKQINSWDEMGFKGVRGIPGKVTCSLTMQRVRSNHNSLLYSCYRWLIAALQGEIKGTRKNLLFGSKDAYVFQSYPGFVAEKTVGKDKYTVADRHYDNIGSEFFCFPFGILAIELDQYMNLVTAIYFENCKAPAISRTISESPLIVEGVQIQATAAVPALGLYFPGIKQQIFQVKETLMEGFNSIQQTSN